MSQSGLVLVQLGTPESTQVADVDKYLREFLTDPYVIDIPKMIRWPLVNWLIVPKRATQSAEAYKEVWTERGSPLRFHTEDLVKKVQAMLPEVKVRLAMRYGQPSIESVLSDMSDCDQISILPLYPQYALSSTETALAEVRSWQKKSQFKGHLHYREDFYDHEGFLTAQTAVIGEAIKEHKPDHLFLSFHGLPIRHVKKTSADCLKSKSCCDSIRPSNQKCYRAQSYATARFLVSRLKWPEEKYTVGFQSRLTRAWIEPFTDHLVDGLAKKGVKKLLVTCPSFTADCLETIEEIGLRAKEQFIEAGGEDLVLVPALNSRDDWAEAITQMHGQTAWEKLLPQ